VSSPSVFDAGSKDIRIVVDEQDNVRWIGSPTRARRCLNPDTPLSSSSSSVGCARGPTPILAHLAGDRDPLRHVQPDRFTRAHAQLGSASEDRLMGLRLKFNLVLLLVLVLGLTVTAYISWGLLQRDARQEVVRTADLMMEAAWRSGPIRWSRSVPSWICS